MNTTNSAEASHITGAANCPLCGEIDNLDYGETSPAENGTLEQKTECSTCGGVWIDTFRIDMVRTIKTGNARQLPAIETWAAPFEGCGVIAMHGIDFDNNRYAVGVTHLGFDGADITGIAAIAVVAGKTSKWITTANDIIEWLDDRHLPRPKAEALVEYAQKKDAGDASQS